MEILSQSHRYKPPFVASTKKVEESSRKKSSIKKGSGKNKTSRSNINRYKDNEDAILNNVKVTDYRSKEMTLLTSQIFDIKGDDMHQSRTSGLSQTNVNAKAGRAHNAVS